MASVSSSSDENSRAPNLNLHVSSSSDDEDAARTGAATGSGASASSLRCMCPLCGQSRRPLHFHCRECVRNGNIVHSARGNLPRESLSEKQQKYFKFQANIKDLSNSYERQIRERRASENVHFEIKCKKEQVQLLKSLIAKKRDQLETLKEQHKQLCKANVEKRKHLPNYPIKVKELENYVLDRIEKIGKLRERHKLQLNELQLVIRRCIHQLVKYIFPISEVVLKDELRPRTVYAAATTAGGGDGLDLVAADHEESETIAALADAKNTSYIRGKWVFHGSGISEMQYRIVGPSLPANGDYSAYLDWLSDNKDDVPKITANETPSRVNAFRIAGALTYTTQLTQLLSYYLNVRLPYKLAYGDFCKKLNEEQFMRKVSRLNTNILYLAYTQQVQLRNLSENHTLENIQAILDVERSDLGRHGFHEVSNAPLMKSVDSLLIGIETATESESEDENSLRLDWEAVPNMPPQHEINNSNLPPPTATQQSSISVIMASANRLTSLWPWKK